MNKKIEFEIRVKKLYNKTKGKKKYLKKKSN
jgi:hypothetical protein